MLAKALFAFLLMTFSSVVLAQTDVADLRSLEATVDKVVEEQIEKQQLAGISVGIIQDGKVACLRS